MVSTPFYENRSTDLLAKTASRFECPFLEPIGFGEAKSTGTRAMGSWTDGHTDGRTDAFWKELFPKIPSHKWDP